MSGFDRRCRVYRSVFKRSVLAATYWLEIGNEGRDYMGLR